MRRNPIVAAIAVTGMVALLSGCVATGASGKQYRIGLEGIQEVPKEEAAASDVAGNDGSVALAPSSLTNGFQITSARDVDTAYLRIKREFGFRDDNERPRPRYEYLPATRESRLIDPVYWQTRMHRTEPGVRYQMAEMLYLSDSRGLIKVDVEKEGDGSRIFVSYQIGDAAGFDKDEQLVRTEIKNRLAKALD